jgi:hypothetical protein
MISFPSKGTVMANDILWVLCYITRQHEWNMTSKSLYISGETSRHLTFISFQLCKVWNFILFCFTNTIQSDVEGFSLLYFSPIWCCERYLIRQLLSDDVWYYCLFYLYFTNFLPSSNSCHVALQPALVKHFWSNAKIYLFYFFISTHLTHIITPHALKYLQFYFVCEELDTLKFFQ